MAGYEDTRHELEQALDQALEALRRHRQGLDLASTEDLPAAERELQAWLDERLDLRAIEDDIGIWLASKRSRRRQGRIYWLRN